MFRPPTPRGSLAVLWIPTDEVRDLGCPGCGAIAWEKIHPENSLTMTQPGPRSENAA